MPRIQARGTARCRGAAESAISIIPDEQDAIAAALRHGRSLVTCCWCFADALVRSWKQITKVQACRESERASPAVPAAPVYAANWPRWCRRRRQPG